MNSLLSQVDNGIDAFDSHSHRRALLINLSGAILFASLMLIVPWEDLQGSPFHDRWVYIDYFLNQESVLEYREFATVLDYVKHEWLWHFLISYLVDELSVSIDLVFGVISFLCLFSFAYFLASRQTVWALPLLVNPLLVTLAFSQLRMALAFSLLLLAYMSGRRRLLIVAVAIGAAIHTAVVMLAAIGIGAWAIRKYLIDKEAPLAVAFGALVFLGAIFALLTGDMLPQLLQYFGDRRAMEYAELDVRSGLKFTLFWIGLLVVTAIQSRSFYQSAENRFAVVILGFAAFSVILGGYASRLLSIGLPLIVSAMIGFRAPLNYVVILLYIYYTSLQWVFWLPIRIF